MKGAIEEFFALSLSEQIERTMPEPCTPQERADSLNEIRRQMALSDWTSSINHERRQIAKNALAEGASLEFVKKITGLSTADIARL